MLLFNPSRAWQTINDLMSRRKNDKTVKELNLNGISVSNFKELSNTVDKQFSTIGSRPASEINNYNESRYIINITGHSNNFGFCQISSNVVLTHLNSYLLKLKNFWA